MRKTFAAHKGFVVNHSRIQFWEKKGFGKSFSEATRGSTEREHFSLLEAGSTEHNTHTQSNNAAGR